MRIFLRNYIAALTAVVSIGTAMLAGCAGLGGRLEPPRVTLSDVRVEAVRLFETVFLLELRILNPNDSPLDIKGVSCHFDLNNKTFASGVSDVQTQIPAYGAGTIPVTVYSSVLGMIRGIQGLQGTEFIRYQLSGHLHLAGDATGTSARVPFKSEGDLSLERMTDNGTLAD
jgi:LEA14-like dessication related protein